jgi:hypothetical protein
MTEVETSARVWVGVTGHRVLSDIDRIVAGIGEAVEGIQRAYPGRPLTVMSALAEGADRIVAEEILLTPRATLEAVLPFPPDDYARDFGPPGSPSRVHFRALLARAAQVKVLPSPTERDSGYRQVGMYIVEHADLLLAVWDMRSTQGRGGTAEIVAEARKEGRPLAIVLAGNRYAGSNEPTSLGADQGRVLLERLPAG